MMNKIYNYIPVNYGWLILLISLPVLSIFTCMHFYDKSKNDKLRMKIISIISEREGSKYYCYDVEYPDDKYFIRFDGKPKYKTNEVVSFSKLELDVETSYGISCVISVILTIICLIVLGCMINSGDFSRRTQYYIY